MASIRSPKSIFLSNGKVAEGLATLMEAPVNQLKFKVLCNFSERFEAAEWERTCQKTGPCFILIQKLSSSKVLGGFTRWGWGWGTQYGLLQEIQAGLEAVKTRVDVIGKRLAGLVERLVSQREEKG